MSKCIVMMGIPTSGKSTFAKGLKEKMERVVLLSSDDMRKELFGNREDNEHNSELFEELHRRAKKALTEGYDVIYDATNINSKRRIGFLKQLPKGVEKELHFFNKDIYSCFDNDYSRDYSVGEEVINRMYKNLQIPFAHEKWTNIIVHNEEEVHNEIGELLSIKVKEMSERLFSYEEFLEVLKCIDITGEIGEMIMMPQDNPFHVFTVDKHSYFVYTHIFEHYDKEDKEDLIIASMFHDIGKPYCKEYDTYGRYAKYYGHDNVGGQMTLRLLMRYGFTQERALKIAQLVALHMRMTFIKDFEADRKLEKLVGSETFIKLNYIRQADISAK